MKRSVLAVMLTAVAHGQVTIPDGTRIRVRLDQTISSATAEEGQAVELSVTEDIRAGGVIAIPQGSHVSGTITMAQAKRRMGRAGKLDFSVDRVRAADGEWIPLRYTMTRKSGQSHATRTGIVTAGVAVAFFPAAPFMLLMKGKDVTINRGVAFDVFTDADYTLRTASAGSPATLAPPAAPAAPVPSAPALRMASQPAPSQAASPAAQPGGSASITITSPEPGAEIEVNGAFVGSTPTTLRLPAGAYQVTVRGGAQVWQRTVQVTAGSTITINAAISSGAPPVYRKTSRAAAQ